MTRKAFFLENALPGLLDLARDAGDIILGFYRVNTLVDRKADASPVTEADRAADRLIGAFLQSLAPEIPLVSEERKPPDITGAERFWLVDPLDGTKGFVRGDGFFTVNIALIERGAPVFGIIYEPVGRTHYWAMNNLAFRKRENETAEIIHCRALPESGPKAIVSHSHLGARTEEYLRARNIRHRLPCASSIKFCFLADGSADLYPRFGPTMEWDTAAGHAILQAAGGTITNPDGSPFTYGKPGFLNGDFVARGSFDPRPLTTMSERFIGLKTQSYPQRAENRDTGPKQK